MFILKFEEYINPNFKFDRPNFKFTQSYILLYLLEKYLKT